jgi:hypothetical protein
VTGLRRFRAHMLVWGSPLLIAAVLVACGSSGSTHASAPATSSPRASATTAPAADVQVTAASFHNINGLTHVRGFFVGNLLGNLAGSLAVARSPNGGEYPVGTILQLVPFEAMVKHRKGFSPATKDWEFFSLDVSKSGTRILARGGAQVVNRFGGSCSGCHSGAKPQFDFVCEHNHGCAPLPVGDNVIAALQKGDPRPLP